MNAVPATPDGDLVGLSVSEGFAHFPGLAAERTAALGALNPGRVRALLEAADAAAFFTRAEPGEAPVRPDARAWAQRISHAGRSRLLGLPEPFDDSRLATLVRLARGCLSGLQIIVDETRRIGAGTGMVGRKPAAGSANIFDALDTPCAGDIEISFDRPVSHPHPAIFD
ncbi:hypothetical protein PQ455_20620 (plasmid) [Sphingomonas naphthae]|uniref:Uncharacterized protein n=1 Tax=Sphingomonas naphthae TaxID=1813468 RepID=A0ABY7TRS1_9SPHN|nr:protealysin inhibitor emfourin [Sphingomonas naphthae]WCT75883.1 hypothetical protein PQ455_20620 [Sphingomonas naphthae]